MVHVCFACKRTRPERKKKKKKKKETSASPMQPGRDATGIRDSPLYARAFCARSLFQRTHAVNEDVTSIFRVTTFARNRIDR